MTRCRAPTPHPPILVIRGVEAGSELLEFLTFRGTASALNQQLGSRCHDETLLTAGSGHDPRLALLDHKVRIW